MDISEALKSAILVNFNHDISQNEATITRTLKVNLDGEYQMSLDGAKLWADLALLDCDAMPKIGDVISDTYLPSIYKGVYFRCVRVHPYLGRENEIQSLYVECTFAAEGLNFAWMIEDSQKCHLIEFHRDTTDYEFQTDKAFEGPDTSGKDEDDAIDAYPSVPITASSGDAVLDGVRMIKPITTLQLTYLVPSDYFEEDLLDYYNCSINTNEITIAGQLISPHAGFITVKNKTYINAHGDGTDFIKFTFEIRIKQGNGGGDAAHPINTNPPDNWDTWPLDQSFRMRKSSDEKLYPITNGMVSTGNESDTTDQTPVSDPVKLGGNGHILPSVYNIKEPVKAIWLYYRVQRQYSWEKGNKIPFPAAI